MTFPNDRGKHWKQERRELVRELAAQGLSASKIATLLGDGATRNAVIGQCARHGIQLLGNSWRAAARHQSEADKSALAARPPKAARPVRVKASAPARKTVLAPIEQVFVPPPSGGVTLLELNDRTCRWPLWRDDERPAEPRYCGAMDAHLFAEPSRPYCACHAAISRGKGTKDERRAVREAERIEA